MKRKNLLFFSYCSANKFTKLQCTLSLFNGFLIQFASVHKSKIKTRTETSLHQLWQQLVANGYKVEVESVPSGSIICRSSSERPVNTTESVSMGLNLMRAEGTRSSSSNVAAGFPDTGNRGITLLLTRTGSNSSNSRLGSFSAELTN